MPRKDPEARRKYHRDYLRRRYAEDAEYRAKHRARTDVNNSKYSEERLRLLEEFKANGCLVCNEKEPCCMSAHHVNNDKSFGIGTANGQLKVSPARLAIELQKCVCVCENCHRKIHAGLITLPERPNKT